MSDIYKEAGVNVHAGYEMVSRIKKHVQKTKIPGVMGSIGGFGGLFDLSRCGVKEPVLVSGTDGVGTKLALAFELGKHDSIGIDAVAMCANDVVTVGAKPLFFLDYIACGKLGPETAEAIVAGIAEGCTQAGCALIGGETAEHPGLMPEGEYDLAGFCVGVAEKENLMKAQAAQSGDVLIGLASSGVHSNGFSLVRKIIKDKNLALNEKYPPLDRSLGEALLAPTRMYVKPILGLWDAVKPRGVAHITGGGFIENVPRILPAGLGAEIDTQSWSRPPIFAFLQEQGSLDEKEMYSVFNMGIGMVLAMPAIDADKATRTLEQQGEKPYIIGRIIQGEGVILK